MTNHRKRNTPAQQKRLGSVKQLTDKYPAFTVGGVRHWLFNDTDGFRSKCAIKIGSKIVIDFDAVDKWLNDHREAA